MEYVSGVVELGDVIGCCGYVAEEAVPGAESWESGAAVCAVAVVAGVDDSCAGVGLDGFGLGWAVS